MDSLVAGLAQVEAELKEARADRDRLAQAAEIAGEFKSAKDVAEHLQEALVRLSHTSLDFADLLRRLIPVFVIQPVQALDRPQVRPRARLTLRLDAWTQASEPSVVFETVLDLFEPPQHIQHLRACVEARRAATGESLKDIARRLGIGHMGVKRALDYSRLMEKEGLTDPYRELTQQPAQAARWKKRRKKMDWNGSV
jgi:hypothetical protein